MERRPVHRPLLLPLLLAVACLLLLLQVSECSRPSPGDHLDDSLHHHHHHHQLLLLDAEDRTAGPPTGADGDAAAPSSASATPARAVVGTVASSSPATPAVPLQQRSKLARRFLAGAGVDEAASANTDTDGAAASCRSNNPHINCGPSASKP